ncbi:MAG: hypothetical protein JRI23_29095 [Deltaproteobacteria bacterium]|jgi:hypothetical protein|nr:hypothetical protein [Deltaproteobacteria bacterium]MBW2536188.1 hypothetical protein [Deltaproteobacteria bacterium]
MTLAEALSEEAKREQVVDDCCQLVDDEVKKKSGLGGAVIKAGYAAVKGIKPGIIRKVVDKLFDAWVEQLEPFWQEAVDRGIAPDEHLEAETPRVAEALLSVTDSRIDGAKTALIRKTYKKLRPSAKKHTESAVPGLAAVLRKHVS